MKETVKQKTNSLLNEIAFIAHVAAKTDVPRWELLKLLKEIKKLQRLKYKLCLVSPDLHNRKIRLKDKLFFKSLNKNNIKLNMICAKNENYQTILKFFPYLQTL